MALQLETPVTTIEGFTVANAYGRVAVADQQQGTYLDSSVTLYMSEADYLNGAQYLNVVGIPLSSRTPYNRDVDGVDVLDLAHTYMILELGTAGINAIKELS